jgi:hypothetical protein
VYETAKRHSLSPSVSPLLSTDPICVEIHGKSFDLPLIAGLLEHRGISPANTFLACLSGTVKTTMKFQQPKNVKNMFTR